MVFRNFLQSAFSLFTAILLLCSTAVAEKLLFPATGVWNGFLAQQNVIECSNFSNQAATLTLIVKNNVGLELGRTELSFAAYETIHTSLNQFAISDAYGTFRLEHSGSNPPLISCHTTFYRLAPITSSKEISYAYAIAVDNPKRGITAGTYNSMNPTASAQPVYNWLTIFNPGSQAFSASIEVYNALGGLDTSASFELKDLKPGDRRDVALGHEYGQVVGSYRIIPKKGTAPYGAFLTRFAANQENDFDFSFPLQALPTTCDTGAIPASTMGNAINWAEIANPNATTIAANIEVFDQNFTRIFNQQISIKPFAQHHVYLNQYIGPNSLGHFRVRCIASQTNSGLLAQSLFYGQHPKNPQRLAWAYVSQTQTARPSDTTLILTSYNTFLSASNWLKVFTQKITTAPKHSLYDSNGTRLTLRHLNTSALGSSDIAIHELAGANQAGLSKLALTTPSDALSAELIRVYPDDFGNIGYIMNVPTRYISAQELNSGNQGGSSSSSSSSSSSGSNPGNGGDKGIQDNGTTISVAENFDSATLGAYKNGHLWHYQWSTNVPNWQSYSTMNVINDSGNKVLEISVDDDLPNGAASFNAPFSFANLNSIVGAFALNAYLKPETDVVRMKIKMLRGKIGLSFGAPVSQVGNSDVLAKVKYLSPTQPSDCIALGNNWLQCDFDLQQNLWRNTRRANFSAVGNNTIKNSIGEEIIHFTRWIQEPLTLYVVPYDSADNKILTGNPVLLIDDIELRNYGKGKAFPTFTSVTPIKTVHNFNNDISGAFTVDFVFPTAQPTPILSHSSISQSNTKSLLIQSKTAEESSWTAVNSRTTSSANAVQFDIRIEASAEGKVADHVIDFLAIATPTGTTFPWSKYPASNGHTYSMNKSTTNTENFAIYHARRILTRNQWHTVTIPFADFAAAYGSGNMSINHSEQLPLQGNEISTIGLQTTYANRAVTTSMYIDNIRYVSVAGNDQSLRSFWQPQAFGGN